MGPAMVAPTLLEWGTEAQKERFIPPTLRYEIRWCQGYSEPGAGSDLASLASRAELDGDHWVIHGHKVWTSLAAQADWMFGLFRTEPDAAKHAGISYLLVPMKQPGVRVAPLRQMNGRRRVQRGVLRRRAHRGGQPASASAARAGRCRARRS